MKNLVLTILGFLFLVPTSIGQTFTGTGGPIHDDNILSDYTIDVQGLMPAELTPAHGLTKVCMNLTHTWVSDLDIRLIGPDGTNIMLTATKGDDQDNYENTCFTMKASEHIITAFAPFTGEFRPFTTLGNVNNGSSGNGTWTLRIWDQFAYADTGEMLNWSIEFGEDAPVPFRLDSTSLPIVLITTDNVTVPNEPKIPGYIKVIDNGTTANKLSDSSAFESNIAIEVRGASSQGFPKKSFGFETQDEFGEDLETELLGMAKEEDWILYAPYTDKSMLRDALTYKLGRDLGHYAPNTVFCELLLNGDYHGIYCLEEKIKRDKKRVNITKLTETDTLGDALTGGYILKVDRHDGEGTFFNSHYLGTDPNVKVEIVYEEPEGPDLHPAQRDYIQQFFHDFEAALFGGNFTDERLGYRGYLNMESLVDFFLVSELGHNVDAYRLSTFFYKDRDSKDSLFHMGPLWDFNLAFGNVNYCETHHTYGWAYVNSSACGNTPQWWPRLLQDPYFVDRVYCRYHELRGNFLSTESIFPFIDEHASSFAEADNRNYERWPILGLYVWPNNFIGNTYDEEINYLKNWIDDRLEWMDENLPGRCAPSSTSNSNDLSLFLSPNPANQAFKVGSLSNEIIEGEIMISTVTGLAIHKQTIHTNEEIDVSKLVSGTYLVSILMKDGKKWNEKLIKL